MAKFIITIILYYTLFGIISFGALTIRRMLPKDRVVNNFVCMLIVFGVVYLLDSCNIILGNCGYTAEPTMMDYKNILIGVSSQIYFQYFIYTLLFSRRAAIKWTIVQAILPAAIIFSTWAADSMGIFSQFTALQQTDYTLSNPLFVVRLSIIVIQFAYALVIAMFALKLIPIYQRYIEHTESNIARNMIWIKEVCYLFLILSSVYTIDALFATFATALLYFAGAILAFSRVIILMLSNYTPNFNLNGNLYATVGVRWNCRKMWYIPQENVVKQQDVTTKEMVFNEVIAWINEARPYINHDFSYSDISDKFPHIEYNIFDQLLRQSGHNNFQAYIRDLRIERAIELMSNDKSNLQLKNIADEVGFDSNSSFSRAFKAAKGVTASQWRDSLTNEE